MCSGWGGWVRTRESGGGLPKGSKGGLLHSQLMELGQLLGEGGGTVKLIDYRHNIGVLLRTSRNQTCTLTLRGGFLNTGRESCTI